MYQYKPSDKWLLALMGIVLSGLGLYVLFSGGIALPKRSPGEFIRFSGLSLILLAGSPLAAGFALLNAARPATRGPTPGIKSIVLTAIVLMILALVTAQSQV